MPKSKNNKDHKKRLLNFKTKKRQMNENQQQLPPVRTVPTWTPDADIMVKGFEWEAIQNAMSSTHLALQAAQSIMSRNIVSGVIKMDFEKLDPQTLQYGVMPEAEKVEHQAAFAQQVEAFKTAQAAGLQEATQSEPVSAEVAVKPTKAKKTAKVISLQDSK